MRLAVVLRNITVISAATCSWVALAAAWSSPAHSETLKQALAAAYRTNPELESERSRLRAADEGVAIANSGYRPRIGANGSLSWEKTTTDPASAATIAVGPTGSILTDSGINRHARYGFYASQPLFTGFQVTNQVRIAEANVRGGRETLRGAEGNLFVQVVSAYVNVIASRKILNLQEQNVSLMQKHVRSARERLAFNELTNTDVAQAQLRMANAQAIVATGRAEVITSRGAYVTFVGHEPNNLTDPTFPRGLPKTLGEALSIASRENPQIVRAVHLEDAARHAVELARGRLLPQVSLGAGWGEDHNHDRSSTTRSTVVEGRMNVPLYEGGEIHAQVRQAKQIHLSSLQAIDAIRAQVHQSVTAAWSQYDAVRARIDLARQQIRTSQTALDGVRREEGIGQRTLLDVLNAQQDYIDAQINMVSVRRFELITAYILMAQIGRLDATLLEMDPVYDPTVHFDEVHRKWFGLTISYPDGRREVVKAP